MPLNDAPPAGPQRLLVLATLALLSPLGCFTGGGNDSGATNADDTSGTETGACDVGTLDCPCTPGLGCDPGLTCNEETSICEPTASVCGNGVVEEGEACDDANEDNTDSCTTLCQAPSCEDGIVSGEETDVDCGMEECMVGCDFEEVCLTSEDCAFPNCVEGICDLPLSCSHWLAHNPDATDNVYTIDPDGHLNPIQPMQVWCHMGKDGGGWTLVFVSSDDGQDTWTWNNRGMMADEVGSVGLVDERNRDFMSPAYHNLPFTDLLFIHQPSNVWARYGDVGDGTMDFGSFIAESPSPVCNYNLADQGYPLSGGTLTASGTLCDTDLYFNLGDHESSLMDCMDFGSPSNTATFGPVWSADQGDGCPFDDPAEVGLGPHGPCGACPANFTSMEFSGLGYGHALNLNDGASNMGENYMQIYVR